MEKADTNNSACRKRLRDGGGGLRLVIAAGID